MNNENKLTDIVSILKKIAYRVDLTEEEAHAALNVIGREDTITDLNHSDGFYLLALTFGIMAKGPTAEELHGFVLSISDNSIKFLSAINPSDLIDVSGTGGDKIKTFNVGTTASFVIAAGGGYVAKQATRGYTGFTGSADIYREIGIDPFSVNSDQVVECLEKHGLVAFYTPAFTGGFKNRIDFLTKLKYIGLVYPTPWHLVSWVYSPFNMTSRVYGVFDSRYVRVLAELFLRLGYIRVMVVYGKDGLDEISNIGETIIAEVDNGSIQEYTVTPEQYGLRRALASEIHTLSDAELEELENPLTTEKRKSEIREQGKERNIRTFFEIIYGKDRGPKRDLVVMNAGAALYLCGKASNLQKGIELAISLIENGKAAKKVDDVASFFGTNDKLDEWKRRVGV